MDARRFDQIVLGLASGSTRRHLLRLLPGLLLTGALSLLLPEETEARRRPQRHRVHERSRHMRQKATAQRHRAHQEKRKKRKKRGCTPESAAQTCAGRCGKVTGNCGTAVDCGACNCGSCQICQTCDASTAQCVPNGSVVGQVCGTCHACSAAGLCESVADGTTCADGNACTQTDTCQGGVCVGSNPVVCTPIDACHVAGTCDPATGVCSNPNAPNQTICAGSGTDTSVCCNGACCNGCCDADGECGSCVVFATSEASTGRITEPGGLLGVAAADARCQRLATNRPALPPLPGTYKAWLSTGAGAGESPLTRFRHSHQPYRLPDGASTKVADDWNDLVSTQGGVFLDHAIDATESGAAVTSISVTWTNTFVTGGESSPAHDCDDWTSASGITGVEGQTDAVLSLWTHVFETDCAAPHRLYCFQQS